MRQPALARGVEAAPCRSGWYTRSATTCPARSSAGVERQLVGADPDRRGVDDDVGAGDVVARADAADARPAPRPPRPAPAVRLTTTTSAAPARPRASTTLRAAAPAPTTTTAAPATSTPASASEATNPSPSVLWPTSGHRHRRADRVDRSQRRRRRRQHVDGGGDVLLVRRRHRQPGDAERAHRVDRRGRRRRARPRRRRRPSPGRPAANAALWIAGDSEWATGEPITAASVRAAG